MIKTIAAIGCIVLFASGLMSMSSCSQEKRATHFDIVVTYKFDKSILSIKEGDSLGLSSGQEITNPPWLRGDIEKEYTKVKDVPYTVKIDSSKIQLKAPGRLYKRKTEKLDGKNEFIFVFDSSCYSGSTNLKMTKCVSNGKTLIVTYKGERHDMMTADANFLHSTYVIEFEK